MIEKQNVIKMPNRQRLFSFSLHFPYYSPHNSSTERKQATITFPHHQFASLALTAFSSVAASTKAHRQSHIQHSTRLPKMTIDNKAPLVLLFVAVVSFLVKPCFSNGVRGGNPLSETFRLNDTSTAAAEWNRHLSSSRSISCTNTVDRMRIVDGEEVSLTVTVASVQFTAFCKKW